MSEPVYLCDKCGVGHTSASCAPREWFVIKLKDGTFLQNQLLASEVDKDLNEAVISEKARVIEKSAYDALKAENKMMREALEKASRRSSYPWSGGPDYNYQDIKNEGHIELAAAMLAKLKESP